MSFKGPDGLTFPKIRWDKLACDTVRIWALRIFGKWLIECRLCHPFFLMPFHLNQVHLVEYTVLFVQNWKLPSPAATYLLQWSNLVFCIYRPLHNMARMNMSAARACLPNFSGPELFHCIRSGTWPNETSGEQEIIRYQVVIVKWPLVLQY